MYRFLLRPRWLAFHLLCVLLMFAMVQLGLWQLRRLDERRSLNAQVTENSDRSVAPFAEVFASANGDLHAIEYRRVEATGQFLADPEFVVINVAQGGLSGRDAVNALRLEDGTLLIVNRGFAAGAAALAPPPAGEVTLIGRVRRTQTARSGQTADDGGQQLTQIRRVDLGALGQQFDEPIAPVYLEWLTYEPPRDGGLEPVPAPALGEGPHLSYAVQWFIFTVCVGVGWVLAVRRSAGKTATPGSSESPL